MHKLVAVTLLVLGTVSVAMAGIPSTPEIDATTGVAALALVSSAVLIIRARSKK
jgi:hypothetical protein